MIKTSAGRSLGTGHLQRMCSLLWYLNEIKNSEAFIVSEGTGDLLPVLLKKYFKTGFNFSPDLIIRDMRDSSEKEIMILKKTAPVLVIDDNGPGRQKADYAIDILPNPEARDKEFNSKIFLYGYNFLAAMERLKNKNIKKELDFVIYPGNSAGSEYINFLISLIPEKSSYAVLKGINSYAVRTGKKVRFEESSYAETILSAKAIISHFGITLYEGFIAKCKIISVNPSAYHSRLTDMAGDYLKVINLGEYAALSITDAKAMIREASLVPLCTEVNTADVYTDIIDGLENFYRILSGLTREIHERQ